MKKRVAYYQGCSLEGLAVEYDISTRALCEALDVELVEIPDWSCCGSTPAHSHDPLLSAALAGRNLAIAEKIGCETVMTPCPGCLKSLKGALQAFHNDGERDSLLELLAMPFSGKIKAVSILQLLYETIGVDQVAQRVSHPLSDLVVAPYYGCLLSRPARFAQFDDPENPVSMDELLRGAGATVVDFSYKTECCGATYGVTRNEIVAELTGRILDMAQGLGARAIVVACPLCQQNLDLRQSQVNRRWQRRFDIPVVYITQLLGLALGIEPEKLALDKLFVKPDFFLKAMLNHDEPLESSQ